MDQEASLLNESIVVSNSFLILPATLDYVTGVPRGEKALGYVSLILLLVRNLTKTHKSDATLLEAALCLVRSTFSMGRTWSLCIISRAHRWVLQKGLHLLYEQSCLWAACRSHDMPNLVVMAQLCSTFVYERRVRVLNPLPHLEAIDSSVASTQEREKKRAWGVASTGMGFWLIVIAAVVIHQQLIKQESTHGGTTKTSHNNN